MKTNILKITALSLLAAALVAAPAAVRAAEKTNAPAAGESPAKHKNSSETVPFHGKLAAVDTKAMTIKVGERTFEITSTTKLTKDGVPATLADAKVGEEVGGAYKRTAGGADKKLIATSVRFGAKSEGEKPEGAGVKKKKSAVKAAGEQVESSPASPTTNSVPDKH